MGLEEQRSRGGLKLLYGGKTKGEAEVTKVEGGGKRAIFMLELTPQLVYLKYLF